MNTDRQNLIAVAVSLALGIVAQLIVEVLL